MAVHGANTDFVTIITGIEKGRIVNRDTCASDPQVMAPPQVEEYYKRFFKNDGTVQIDYHKLDGEPAFKKWPLCEAVNRAVNGAYDSIIMKKYPHFVIMVFV